MIADVLQEYFDGLYDGDTAKLARVFHPAARLRWVADGVVQEMSRDAWLAVVAGRTAPRAAGLTRTDRIVAVDVTDDLVASARVECSIHPKYFVDHLTLAKTDRWQIIEKAYVTRLAVAT